MLLLAILGLVVSGCGSRGRAVKPGEVFSEPDLGLTFSAPPGEWTLRERSEDSARVRVFSRTAEPAQDGEVPESVFVIVSVGRSTQKWIDNFPSRADMLDQMASQWLHDSDQRFTVVETRKNVGSFEGAERLTVYQRTQDSGHPSFPGQTLVEELDIVAGFSPRDRFVGYMVLSSTRASQGQPRSVRSAEPNQELLRGMKFEVPK